MYANSRWQRPRRIYSEETFGFRDCFTELKIDLLLANKLTERSIQAGANLHFYVSSKEITKGGNRFFIVATREEVHASCMHVLPKDRTFYEITQIKNCFMLVLDIECSIHLKPNFNYELAMVIWKIRVSF